ncbi:MAG: class I SAM-dependent methyltransferase [Moorea sp. SIO4A3]|nr:class I SAM-dependent methyltransferase [Moorena sp. SIO4A3]
MQEKYCCPWEHLFYEPVLLDSASGDADSGDTVEYYQSALKSGEHRILDIGCGTGRLAIPLAQCNYEVHAVDCSPEMISFFQDKLKSFSQEGHSSLQDNLHLSSLDIVTSSYGKKVDVAIAVDDFLTHFLDKSSLRSALKNIALSLKLGGRFLTDLRGRSQERLAKASQAGAKPMLFFGIVHQVSTPSGNRSVAMRSAEDYDPHRQIMTSNQIFEWIAPDGTVERTVYRTLRQRLYHQEELEKIALDVGLRLVSVYKRLHPMQPASFTSGMSLEFCTV